MIVYGLMVLAFVLWSLLAVLRPGFAVVLPASGLLFWTVVEYVLHRNSSTIRGRRRRVSISTERSRTPDDPGWWWRLSLRFRQRSFSSVE